MRILFVVVLAVLTLTLTLTLTTNIKQMIDTVAGIFLLVVGAWR